MNQVNYQESIVIPTLQKKLQELQTSNLVFEVSLLVEQAKIKDIDGFYKNQIGDVAKLKEEISNKDNRITSLKGEINSIIDERNAVRLKNTELENNLNRQISVRESIHSEYNHLKEKFDSLSIECDTLKQSINTKKVKEPKLV